MSLRELAFNLGIISYGCYRQSKKNVTCTRQLGSSGHGIHIEESAHRAPELRIDKGHPLS